MDAVKFLSDIRRMCLSFSGCARCPLHDAEFGCVFEDSHNAYPPMADESLVAIVEEWSRKNPPKTRKSDFLSKYPNAEVGDDGIPNICCSRLGYLEICPENIDCADCWNTPLEEIE